MALKLGGRARETFKECPWIFLIFFSVVHNLRQVYLGVHKREVGKPIYGVWRLNPSDGGRGSRSWATGHFRVGGCGNGTMRSSKGRHHVCPSIAERGKATTGADDLSECEATGRRCHCGVAVEEAGIDGRGPFSCQESPGVRPLTI